MGHIDRVGLTFVTEAKGNRLIDDDGKMQAWDYLACHSHELKEVATGTGFHYAHEVVSEIKGGTIVKFVFLKQCLEDEALVLMTNALDMSIGEVICSYESTLGC